MVIKYFLILLVVININTHNNNLIYLNDNDADGCWLFAEGRGVGKAIHTCNELEKNGLLCYPYCKENFTGVGPVCWENCPDVFHDDGAFCRKPTAYGRGVGYALWNKQKCLNENQEGCEKWGLLYYPKCKSNYHNFLCCICSPDCPSDMVDIGVSCAKNSYGRGAGIPLQCDHKVEEYDTGLCYNNCDNGLKGIGPVCWGSCPSGYEECGALCLKNQTCAGKIKEYVEDILKIVKDIAEKNVPGTIIDIGKLATDLIYPICKVK